MRLRQDRVSKVREIDTRVGGKWRFDMKAPDGTVFDNRIVFLEMRAPEVVTMRQLHPTKEHRAAAIGFGAVEIGYGTIDNLAEYLRKLR